MPTTLGTEWVRKEAGRLENDKLAEKLVYQPHSQRSNFSYSGIEKGKLVISLARWKPEDWGQKNTRVLIEAYRGFLAANPEWKGMVLGIGATRLLELMDLAPNPSLEFMESMESPEVPALLNRASIGFWSSRWEGQHGTGAQALCCGCSVVSHGSPMMSCFRHYVSRDRGRLAGRNAPERLAEALSLEAHPWEKGERNPFTIAENWGSEFHAGEVAGRALAFLGLDPVS